MGYPVEDMIDLNLSRMINTITTSKRTRYTDEGQEPREETREKGGSDLGHRPMGLMNECL